MKLEAHVVSLTLPAEAEYIDLVRLTLYGISSKLGFSYEEIEDMKVAVAEACNNAVVHAYDPGISGQMEVSFERIEDGLRIIIKDHGPSFDFNEKVSRAGSLHEKTLNEINVGGLGIYLMQALMDEVEVITGVGTEVILTKRVSRSEEMV
ncbi:MULTISPECIES: anti-sigma B factor RsbW [unclassified Paenibacillus]|uniref:anti-sigma B factor RsbW n=1 Tax=unclassified Paenibacillus TaxID=185978 RepID=UPI001AEAE6B1|nr:MULTISPECIES: anti-sigma B factor RsbW [unclassified Paenibacillus]MBP1153909.1 serine/threonine-protein kinase RsbW [Paenibacillus sp. PvP091]MBP1170706.1 serine/threonine-protein kinase RsbW [Paenibacillus sp. PvR098]MBP2441734.1 serine/threonine-protein kinase RsbW [Paenibacillus sp. PvP052]